MEDIELYANLQIAAIEEAREDLKGLSFEIEEERHYPDGVIYVVIFNLKDEWVLELHCDKNARSEYVLMDDWNYNDDYFSKEQHLLIGDVNLTPYKRPDKIDFLLNLME